jgi:hypothetical protein
VAFNVFESQQESKVHKLNPTTQNFQRKESAGDNFPVANNLEIHYYYLVTVKRFTAANVVHN